MIQTKETQNHILYSNGIVYSKYTKRPMKFFNDKDGYLITRIRLDGLVRTVSLHRLMAYFFIPNPENKPQVNHKDGNKLNNDISNLEWVTSKENTMHAIENGLTYHPRGELSHKSKLKEAEVITIRRLYKSNKYSQQYIANLFGVSRGQISKITLGNSWV